MHWRTFCHKISLAHSGPFFLIFSIGFYILFFKNHVWNKELFSNQISSNGFFLTVYLSCICYLKIKFEWKTLFFAHTYFRPWKQRKTSKINSNCYSKLRGRMCESTEPGIYSFDYLSASEILNLEIFYIIHVYIASICDVFICSGLIPVASFSWLGSH